MTPTRFLLASCVALTSLTLAIGAHANKPAGKPAPAQAGKRHAARPAPVAYGLRADVMRYADDVAARRSLDPAWVRGALAQARYLPEVARLILPPPAGTAKNWAAYRARFVEPVRLRAGSAFWRANAAWLAKAEAVYGVPPEIVVGIVGVETLYGRQMGGFRIVDALATLSFDFPAGRKDRSAFFRDELESYLVMCHDEGIEPLALKGSYAGAMGMPQFMPSSVLKYAVDFDGDGHVDLHADAADVIGSVAHYLAEFGWQRGLPTRLPVLAPVDTSERAALLAPDILPSFTVDEFARRGARLDGTLLAGMAAPAASELRLALVELQNGSAAPSYVAGTTNFYAITRYNWSSYYAMAVIELGEAVRRDIERADGAAALTPALSRGRERE
ncbi:MAG: lytic murein transglycosylase B [Proteobacteria bacterium]|nr:lytic murein transglycosylase B [Pseudomonadota bacterium]